MARDLQLRSRQDEMRWKTQNPPGRFTLRESIEIDAPVDSVFAQWNRFEAFPRFMDSVRRTKCIDAQRALWDVDVSGRQIVWEARVVERVPSKLVRWESSWGAPNQGEVRLQDLGGGRTRLEVDIEFQPRGLLEHLGARIGLLDQHVERDLRRFRDHLERGRPEEAS